MDVSVSLDLSDSVVPVSVLHNELLVTTPLLFLSVSLGY